VESGASLQLLGGFCFTQKTFQKPLLSGDEIRNDDFISAPAPKKENPMHLIIRKGKQKKDWNPTITSS